MKTNNSLYSAKNRVKGARGGGVDDLMKVKIEFSVVSDRGECQLQDALYRIKKILFLAEVIEF